jgi:hypothetical protein
VTPCQDEERQVTTSNSATATEEMGVINKSRYKNAFFRALSIIVMLSGVIAIAFIEKTIQINHLDMSDGSITAASQLIPLVIGACVLFFTFAAVLMKSFIRLVTWISRQKSLSEGMEGVYKKLQVTILILFHGMVILSTLAESHSHGQVTQGRGAEDGDYGSKDIEVATEVVQQSIGQSSLEGDDSTEISNAKKKTDLGRYTTGNKSAGLLEETGRKNQ